MSLIIFDFGNIGYEATNLKFPGFGNICFEATLCQIKSELLQMNNKLSTNCWRTFFCLSDHPVCCPHRQILLELAYYERYHN